MTDMVSIFGTNWYTRFLDRIFPLYSHVCGHKLTRTKKDFGFSVVCSECGLLIPLDNIVEELNIRMRKQ